MISARGPETFAGRAPKARGEWPPVGAAVGLDTLPELVMTAAEVAPLVSLFIEEDDPEVCLIGRPVGVSRRSIHLQEIDPEARWDQRPTTWTLTSVTRVDFGGRYEEGLTLVGVPPPALRRPPNGGSRWIP